MKFNINIKNACSLFRNCKTDKTSGKEKWCIHFPPSLIFKHCFTVSTPVFLKLMIMVIYKWCANPAMQRIGFPWTQEVWMFAWCAVLLAGFKERMRVNIGRTRLRSSFVCWLPSSKNLVPTTSLYLPPPQCESVSLGLYPLAGGRNEVLGSESVLPGALLWREAPVKRRKAPLQMRENQ